VIDSLQNRLPHLPLREIYSACGHSRSQLYKWRQAATLDRKPRPPKALDEGVIQNAANVVATFPHFGGGKGQAFMLYHELGLIGQKAYDKIKKMVKHVLCQEVHQRKDLPARVDKYEHIRPERIGQIWAEDFTEIVVDGISFKLALLIDVFTQYILGWELAQRATEALVASPVLQALAVNGGQSPEKFLIQDNGKQYTSESHHRLLDAHEIVARHIPAYTPQYNGAVECGGKEFKNVFFNVWEQQKGSTTDKEKPFNGCVREAVAKCVHLLNDTIPRPFLGGVTPADVHAGKQEQQQKKIEQYRQEQEVKKPPPLSKSIWDVIKSGVKADRMSTKQLLIKLAFFGMRPLRRVAQLNREVWGN